VAADERCCDVETVVAGIGFEVDAGKSVPRFFVGWVGEEGDGLVDEVAGDADCGVLELDGEEDG